MTYLIDLLNYMITMTFILGIYTILWKENPYYRIVQ
ncbi:unnamed protein product, partial [marine sediment metagenome]